MDGLYLVVVEAECRLEDWADLLAPAHAIHHAGVGDGPQAALRSAVIVGLGGVGAEHRNEICVRQ